MGLKIMHQDEVLKSMDEAAEPYKPVINVTPKDKELVDFNNINPDYVIAGLLVVVVVLAAYVFKLVSEKKAK